MGRGRVGGGGTVDNESAKGIMDAVTLIVGLVSQVSAWINMCRIVPCPYVRLIACKLYPTNVFKIRVIHKPLLLQQHHLTHLT